MSGVLTPVARGALRAALQCRLIVVCFGAGVDSTAMLVALHAAGIRPHVITFADTGGERPDTLAHVQRVNAVLRDWGWTEVVTVRKVPLASTGYADLYGNCVANETLPSLAFGLKSCSIKWKQVPQDQYLQGVSRGPATRPPHPLWLQAQASGVRIVKLIGYDCGRADLRRSRSIKTSGDAFDYVYPLQLVGWSTASTRSRPRWAPSWCRSSQRASSARPARPGSFGGWLRIIPTCSRRRCSWSASRSQDATAVSMRWSSVRPGRT